MVDATVVGPKNEPRVLESIASGGDAPNQRRVVARGVVSLFHYAVVIPRTNPGTVINF